MAWQNTKPAASDLISNSQSDIQGNFLAIENGLVPFDEIYLEKQASAPTGAVDKAFLYSIDDTTAEVYAMPEHGTQIQLTQDGRLGSSATNIGFESFSHDGGTTSYDENNFASAWGHFTSTGADLNADAVRGLSAANNSDGLFTVSFDTAAGSANYAVIATVTATSSSDNAHIINVHTLATGQFQVIIKNDNGTLVDRAFSVMVLGGR